MTDIIFSYRKVRQVHKVSKSGLYFSDPVEPHVECGEADELVDHGRYLGQPVVPAIQDAEVLQVGQLLRQPRDHVFRKLE